jgi:acyl-[acyl-carrier-protein] desaturase
MPPAPGSTDRELLASLADELELNLRRHIAAADRWPPHDYVP